MYTALHLSTYGTSLRTTISSVYRMYLKFLYNLQDRVLPIKTKKKVHINVCPEVRFLSLNITFNPLNPELNPICYLLALLGAHHFLHVSRIRVKLLTFRLLMSYIYGAHILYVSRSHTQRRSTVGRTPLDE